MYKHQHKYRKYRCAIKSLEYFLFMFSDINITFFFLDILIRSWVCVSDIYSEFPSSLRRRCLTSSTRRWFWTSSDILACWRRSRFDAPASPSGDISKTSAPGVCLCPPRLSYIALICITSTHASSSILMWRVSGTNSEFSFTLVPSTKNNTITSTASPPLSLKCLTCPWQHHVVGQNMKVSKVCAEHWLRDDGTRAASEVLGLISAELCWWFCPLCSD